MAILFCSQGRWISYTRRTSAQDATNSVWSMRMIAFFWQNVKSFHACLCWGWRISGKEEKDMQVSLEAETHSNKTKSLLYYSKTSIHRPKANREEHQTSQTFLHFNSKRKHGFQILRSVSKSKTVKSYLIEAYRKRCPVVQVEAGLWMIKAMHWPFLLSNARQRM